MKKIILDAIEERFDNGENPTELMNELEKKFKIPMVENPKFNKENQEVMKLYRKIANSRWL